MRLTAAELARACGGRLMRTHGDAAVTSVCIDSRAIRPGAAFFAIRAARDGHSYVRDAIEKGAVCAVADTVVDESLPLIVVDDTARALLAAAAYYRGLYDGTKVIAVTGSAGKTTTKDMVACVLGQKYKTKKTQGNLNNHLGVPLTLFQLEDGDEAVVVEMGMNHAGEIHALSTTAAPDIAIITNIGEAHIENFDDRAGILAAKLEIADGLKAGGKLIVNGDDTLLAGVPRALYCHVDEALLEPLGMDGTRYTLNGRAVHIPLPGLHMVRNALLAAKTGELLGLTPDQIQAGLEAFTPSGDRMETVSAHGMRIINDAYNANPTAMKAALSVLRDLNGRKVAILGDMYELGRHAAAYHREVGRCAAASGVTLVAVGTLAAHMAEGYNAVCPGALYFPDKDAFLACWKDILRHGDTVLLKASHGMAFNDIVKEIRQ